MPAAGQKRLRHRRPTPRSIIEELRLRVCALHEPPPRPLRLVPSTPTRTLTSYTAVRPGPQRPVYVSGLARVGREHRSKRCASMHVCRLAFTRAPPVPCAPTHMLVRMCPAVRTRIFLGFKQWADRPWLKTPKNSRSKAYLVYSLYAPSNPHISTPAPHSWAVGRGRWPMRRRRSAYLK